MSLRCVGRPTGPMPGAIALDTLVDRLKVYVGRRDLKPEALRLLEQTLQRGELPRGEAGLVTGLRERAARDLRCAILARALALFSRQIRTILKADSHHPGDSLMNLGQPTD